MEPETNQQNRIEQMDDIAKSFQRESEALRELVRNRDQQIKALKSHSLCLRANFKIILNSLLDKAIYSDIQYHARKMIDELDQADAVVEKVGNGQ